ncbi:MAG: transcriptional regulator [Sphingobacteriia bacterium 24-36-13]|jgi:DNA-binding transcriptional ArsR family regulator|nr:metalloregulator ArsR/SmtB family transcription factor [Sediminibacterium sp.]OYZ55340.1 MAG: transcriptional regulator [Sphingobacteriia bacterium 24-36-13]OZA66300.1 MAG: transcriptional regulator [Sphingobacteriia bacterium 39-36-14]RWZ89454.1 MAG: ArsR family transcriptional regulator [Hydrotalea sp. AMD]HQS22878.1 metalloregulator ArsR/SmtB family transcription factor [Sediminibacterium sp.]HQS33945.1 metalloregulator ArsR/SmtB family transcription factor [Sediminibacterium sp.]
MENLNSCIREKANQMQIQDCRSIIYGGKDSFLQLSALLSLAGNEVRLKILYLLDREKELCPCDLSDILGMTVPAISQHLRKMKDGHLIEFRKEGQTIFYFLKSDSLSLLTPFFSIINQENLIPQT